MQVLYQFAASYAMQRPVALNIRLPSRKPRTVDEIEDLCKKHNYLELYLWLAQRYPKYFIEKEVCSLQKNHALKMIEQALFTLTMQAGGTHAGAYKRMRDSMRQIYPDDLPPIEYGSSIREATKTHLAAVDRSVLLHFTPGDLEAINSFSFNRDRPYRRDKDSHKGNSNKVSREHGTRIRDDAAHGSGQRSEQRAHGHNQVSDSKSNRHPPGGRYQWRSPNNRSDLQKQTVRRSDDSNSGGVDSKRKAYDAVLTPSQAQPGTNKKWDPTSRRGNANTNVSSQKPKPRDTAASAAISRGESI
jgi:hypothetical protein